MSAFQSIIVKEQSGKDVRVEANPAGLLCIGTGRQGAVFKISSTTCVKIFGDPKKKEQEEIVLWTAQNSPFFPKIYETGSTYIVMELIDGEPLNKYLDREKYIPKWLTLQILLMIKELKNLNLARHDARLRHIYVLENEQRIKVIDHVNSGTTFISQPKKLFQGLKKCGVLSDFLNQTQEIDIDTYDEWKKTMRKFF
ncbi:hypothetical protein DS745_22325 [Anaerobacillus alkaliphilus]|uniref:Serine/threonine protein kinase n=1 Tax=Anaerobacillus alkaliphilus TaxID=1548597 RepID=A0A4Q0VNL4_9BACI|nr:hypothetical protein [Anaerobacillus alkaliphilus]RXI96450.1 hypothetical protein DS745_22325 [Anaerobacillus alkaliphilus]